MNASYNIMTTLFYYRCQDEAEEKQASRPAFPV